MPKRGDKRGSYSMKRETRGYTGRESHQCRSFWTSHKMEDIMTMSPEELDKTIDIWLEQKYGIPLTSN